MPHPEHVEGWNGSLPELATAIGAMRYDRVIEFIELLATEMRSQADADKARGRAKLAVALSYVELRLLLVSHSLNTVWKICEPFEKKDRSET